MNTDKIASPVVLLVLVLLLVLERA